MRAFFRDAICGLVLLMACWAAMANPAAVSAVAARSSGEVAAGDASPRSVHERCLERCAAIEVGCGSHARQAKQNCMKTAATGGVDPFTQRRELGGYFCAWFRADHCGAMADFRGCTARYLAIYESCNTWFDDNTTRRYLDCNADERQLLQLCRSELADCRSACD